MTDPDRQHTTEPAEGADRPGQQVDARTPHSEEPAEGPEGPEGDERPDA